jgi:hypothetical protein
MAKLAESEAVVWRQADMLRRLREEILGLQRVIAVVARREGGVLVIAPEEVARLPHGTVIVRAVRPDGAVVIRTEPGTPGTEGAGND